MSDAVGGGPLDAAWREAAEGVQVRGLPPPGRVAVSCSAPLGTGGLGRHLQEIVAALARGGRESSVMSGSTRDADGGARAASAEHLVAQALARLHVPLSAGVRARAFLVDFDAHAARRLPAAEHLIAFNSQALRQFDAARRAGYSSLGLVSANPHLGKLARQHALARRRYPIEGSWASRMLAQNLAEYALADRILVASRYIRESFLAEGFAEERLVDFPLTPDPRFGAARRDNAGAGTGAASDRFDVVYVGSLSVHKGVPLLIDAFRRVPHTDARLVLVGGWGTRGMRRFVQAACALDRRIELRPGDPLPSLRGARVCVHAAYEDGFGYAPAEALAARVPVIVSEDTGMKELIDSPRRGLVLPTGDLAALTEAISAAYRGELFDS
jgi:glycosyltransferase involved in cell wall biosynthesis